MNINQINRENTSLSSSSRSSENLTALESNLDINSICDTITQRGKIIFQEVETRVLSSEFLCPELRHLYVNDNGSSSSRPEHNSVSGLSESLSYYPMIKRIIYYKDLYDTKYNTVAEDIPYTSSFYRSVFRNINGHLMSVNSLNNNKHLPDVAVIQYKKVVYENGFTEKYPMICDYLMMPSGYWWKRSCYGQYDLELMDSEMIAQRKIWTALYPNKFFDLYTDHEKLPLSQYISECSILCFFSIDLGGFGSFYAKVVLSFVKIYKEKDFYICWIKTDFTNCMEKLKIFIFKSFYSRLNS